MGEAGGVDDSLTTEEWLSCAQRLVPTALAKAREANGFPARWKMIVSKLDQIPARLSDLSSHPCFSKNALCREQLQTMCKTLDEVVGLAAAKYDGKLRMQSDLDALVGKLDLNLRDCSLLIKTGVLGEASAPPGNPAELNLRELLARLQIGHLEAKHKAVDSLVEVMKEDEKTMLAVVGRSSISALVQLLTATSPRIREKTATVICTLSESANCESWLVSEGVLPPLIRLAESGSTVGKEKAIIALQRLSMSPETARSIVGHGGVRPLVDICQSGDSVTQTTAACALKNISAVPEARKVLAEEGGIKLMIDLIGNGILLEAKEYAAECLQSLTSSNNELRRAAVAEGGLNSLLSYIDGPLPQESAVAALQNLIGSVSSEVILSAGVLPRLVHVLTSGSPGAQQAAASTICQISSSIEMKRAIGEAGCIPFLVRMLEAKGNGAKEAAVQAIAGLVSVSMNCRELKKEEKSVAKLVALLEPKVENRAKKYAVAILVAVSSSRRCKKVMISYGAIGYLKKLVEMGVPGAKKLLERVERGKLRSLFSRK